MNSYFEISLADVATWVLAGLAGGYLAGWLMMIEGYAGWPAQLFGPAVGDRYATAGDHAAGAIGAVPAGLAVELFVSGTAGFWISIPVAYFAGGAVAAAGRYLASQRAAART